MNNSNKVVICILILMSSCSIKDTKAKDINENLTDSRDIVVKTPYYINIEKSFSVIEPVNLSILSKNITYVPLETSSNCLLKGVHEYRFYNNNFLVSEFSNLYQFDVSGKFVKKIGQKGSGPTDYIYINSIVNDNDQNIFNVFTRGKVNIYDKDMNYLKSLRILDGDGYYKGITTPWETYLMYLGCTFKLDGDTTTIYSFSEISGDGKTLRKIKNSSPIVSKHHGMIISNNIPLYNFKNEIRYMDYGNDTLFTFSQNGDKKPYAICNLGSMKREVDTHGYNPKQIEALDSKVLIDNICEDENFLYITLRWGMSDKFQYILFDKLNGEVKNIGNNGFVNDIDGLVSFFPQSIDETGIKIMCISSEKIVEKNQEISSAISLSKLKEDDNPVFVIIN